jgi:polyphosphate kinase
MTKVEVAGDDQARKMKRKDYEKELRKLQVELCRLQEWVKYKGSRIIILFEGRDAAGKGGTIKAITERVTKGRRSSEWSSLRSAPTGRKTLA